MRDVLLLVALPASGKSEIRRALDHLDADGRRSLGIGVAVHLDDYPYVHLMRRISEVCADLGAPPPFFESPDLPFSDRRDWSTLTTLLDEDAASVLWDGEPPPAVAEEMLERFDRVRGRFGITPAFAALDPAIRSALGGAVSAETARIGAGVRAACEAWRDGDTTLVIEFARGGPEGSSMPLPDPLGYRHALGLFAPRLLRRAMLLSVWVTPEQSKRRNEERARPGPEGDASILHHGVPEAVMREDYGCDDVGWLLDGSEDPGTIDVALDTGPVTIPAARVDNRDDLTSHLRGEPEDWNPAATAELHSRLAAAITAMTQGAQP